MSNKLVKKWEDLGMLQGIHDDSKAAVALALESQRLWNHSADVPTRFLKWTLPLVRRVLPEIPFDIKEAKGFTTHGVVITDIPAPTDQYDGHGGWDMQLETKLVAETADKLKKWLRAWSESHGSVNFKAFVHCEGRIGVLMN